MNYEKELNLIYNILDFYQQETVEVNGEWCISVKGTAKAYDVRVDTIRKQIQNNLSIFNEHILLENNVNKNFIGVFPKNLKYDPKRKWLDKFAFLEIGTLLRSSPKTICFLNNKWVPFVEVDEAQTYYLVDKKGKFFITLEQNAIATGSNYESDGQFWSRLKKRNWKDFPKLKVFEEGYNRDYIYEERKNIPILQSKQANPSNLILNQIGNKSSKMPRIGKSMVLLTMRGAIKFNMWKRTEGGKISKYYFFFHFF